MNMKGSTAGTEKRSHDGVTVARAYHVVATPRSCG